MYCKPIEASEAARLLDTWYEERQIEEELKPKLPNFILGVYNTGSDCVAMGAIVQTDMDYCMIDCLVANPKLSEEARSKALDLLYYWIGMYAISMGYKRALMMTSIQKVADRAIIFGGRKFKNTEVFELTADRFKEALNGHGRQSENGNN